MTPESRMFSFTSEARRAAGTHAGERVPTCGAKTWEETWTKRAMQTSAVSPTSRCVCWRSSPHCFHGDPSPAELLGLRFPKLARQNGRVGRGGRYQRERGQESVQVVLTDPTPTSNMFTPSIHPTLMANRKLGSHAVILWLGVCGCGGGAPMFSEGLEKWVQVCWSHPGSELGSETVGWGLRGTGTQRRPSDIREGTWHNSETFCSITSFLTAPAWFTNRNRWNLLKRLMLTWNRWPPCRRVAGLSWATGLSVLQKWMLDSRGLGVNRRVGVWGGKQILSWTFQVLFHNHLN